MIDDIKKENFSLKMRLAEAEDRVRQLNSDNVETVLQEVRCARCP